MDTALKAKGLTHMNLFVSEYKLIDKLVELADSDGRVTISNNDLAAECGVHRNTAHRGTLRLEAAGLVAVERRTETGKGTGGKLPNIYTVHADLRASKEV